jgi:F-box protein 20
VLRVEQLLLQIEQQELKRQREKLIMHKNIARRELDEGVKMLMTNNNASTSLQELNNVGGSTSVMTNGSAPFDNAVSYRHVHNHHRPHPHNHTTEYRKSMPNLQEYSHAATSSAWNHHSGLLDYPVPATSSSNGYQYGDFATSSRSEMHLHAPTPYQQSPPIPPPPSTSHIHRNNEQIYGNMSRNALMQISAVPKPKLTNDWIQYRKSEPSKPSLNSHWLIQEAEQRRIEQMNNVRSSTSSAALLNASKSKKPLPDAVIQTIQQRIVDLGIGSNVNKR